MKILRKPGLVLATSFSFLLAISVRAEVSEVTDDGFESRGVVEISKPRAHVFSALIGEIGHWWDPAHTFSGDSKHLSLEGVVGGCFCERFPKGGGTRHMTVVHLDPGKLLRMEGGLGPLQELAVNGVMSFALSDIGGGTRLEWTYAVHGLRPGGLRDWAAPVDGVVAGQMQRLERYLETGSPAVE